ncbi:pollen allergen Phl p 2-like [Panicum miliaceum]|uniref:Pollen allergen Phl p 2-like n=1 Tax=Panicum miliaceum TaxID=4540 RepID=A0A3L6RLE1_PANMI|nr:pollen allergen Phl p 2-like [Panicum miliaceum]
MASTRSSILLAATVLAALLAVGSCASSWLTLKAGPGCSATKLVLIPSVPIPDVAVKEKGANDFTPLRRGRPAPGPRGKAALKGPSPSASPPSTVATA